MRIEQLLENHINSGKQILKESCDGLTQEQRIIVEGIYNEFVPLIEATLTADQIKGIFKGVEQAAVAGGDNRTLAGLGVDGVKKVNDTVNQIGKWLQNTTPVKNFDAKFEQLKDKINKKYPDSKFLDAISEMGMWAQENPGKTAAIIGVLTAMASLAGGPVGGAIAGQILKGSLELLKGEKLSTAIGKGMKAAAVGWLAGKSMEAVGKLISGAYEHFNPIPLTQNRSFSEINIGNGLPSTFQEASVLGTPQQLSSFTKAWGKASDLWDSGNFEAAKAQFETAKQIGNQITQETLKKITIEGDPAENCVS